MLEEVFDAAQILSWFSCRMKGWLLREKDTCILVETPWATCGPPLNFYCSCTYLDEWDVVHCNRYISHHVYTIPSLISSEKKCIGHRSSTHQS